MANAPSVTVLSTGGTIASTAGEAGATPEKSGADLVSAVPELDAYAEITVEEVMQAQSFDLSLEELARIARAAASAAENADGVVITHGTDTMEESAYYLDLVSDFDSPVVFTGAQRRPDEVSPDGSANLLTAVRAAAHEYFAEAGGVYIAFDEEVHAARDVTKTHTGALDTFRSPETGPVAAIRHTGLRAFREPGSRSASVSTAETSKQVVMVHSAVGVSGRQVTAAVETGADGIVIEGTGLGNATGAIVDAAREAISEGVPVVITSRCGAGAVAPVYGGAGGGETLRSAGAISASNLPAHKARLKLMLVLEALDDEGTDDEGMNAIEERFET